MSWSERPARELVRLAWPITVSMMSFSTMALAGTAFVARSGADQLAGVGLGAVVGFAVVCFGFGLLRGAKTLVSQALGAGRHERIAAVVGTALAIGVSMGVLVALVTVGIAPLVAQLSATPAAGAYAAEYMTIRAFGAPVVLAFAALRETSYGKGDSRSPMRASLAGNVVNIGLDAVLILGLGWGVRGAAVAGLCGTIVECAVLAWPMRAQLRQCRVSRDALRGLLAQGLPSGVQFTMEVGAFAVLTMMVSRMSAVDGAAHQMVLHIVNVSFLPAHALGESAAVLVGQAVGAGRFELVRKVARQTLAIGVGYSLFCGVLLATLGGAITSGLAGEDHHLATTAWALTHVALVFLVADAGNVIARGVLRGSGDVRYAALVGIVTSWLTMPPLAWWFGMHAGLGVRGAWMALAVEIIVAALLFWRRIARGDWHAAALAARAELR